MINIIFVCTGNICRSPMGEYYLKFLINKHSISSISAFSAGIFAVIDKPASENGRVVMNELGIDMSQHLGTQLTDYMINLADWILVMENFHKEVVGMKMDKVRLLSEFSPIDTGYDIKDPYGQAVEEYRITRDRIIECTDSFFKTLSI